MNLSKQSLAKFTLKSERKQSALSASNSPQLKMNASEQIATWLCYPRIHTESFTAEKIVFLSGSSNCVRIIRICTMTFFMV